MFGIPHLEFQIKYSVPKINTFWLAGYKKRANHNRVTACKLWLAHFGAPGGRAEKIIK